MRSVRAITVLIVSVVVATATMVAACRADRESAVGPGDEVRLSRHWSVTVPEGWEGTLLTSGEATLKDTGGTLSELTLSDRTSDGQIILDVLVVTDADPAQRRLEQMRAKPGATVIQDTSERTAVRVDEDDRWAYQDLAPSPDGEHLWSSLVSLDGSPWRGSSDSLGDQLRQLLNLRAR